MAVEGRTVGVIPTSEANASSDNIKVPNFLRIYFRVCLPNWFYPRLPSRCLNDAVFRRYEKRPSLEYSAKMDAAFCFACHVYGVARSNTTFISAGYRD